MHQILKWRRACVLYSYQNVMGVTDAIEMKKVQSWSNREYCQVHA